MLFDRKQYEKQFVKATPKHIKTKFSLYGARLFITLLRTLLHVSQKNIFHSSYIVTIIVVAFVPTLCSQRACNQLDKLCQYIHLSSYFCLYLIHTLKFKSIVEKRALFCQDNQICRNGRREIFTFIAQQIIILAM